MLVVHRVADGSLIQIGTWYVGRTSYPYHCVGVSNIYLEIDGDELEYVRQMEVFPLSDVLEVVRIPQPWATYILLNLKKE